MTLPGEIRIKIYDTMIYERLHFDHKDKLESKGRMPVPMARGLLELRLVNRQFSNEVFDRFFTWGTTFRLSMIPQLSKAIDVRLDTEYTRKDLGGTCPTGTNNVAGDFGFRLPSFRPLLVGVPPTFADAWKSCQFLLEFRCCKGTHKCNACRTYNWEKVAFDVYPTLKHVIGYHAFCLPHLLGDIVITQGQNWLSYKGKKLRAVGEEEDFVVSSEGTNGHELEWDLRTAYNDVKFRVTIKTLCNPEPESYHDI
jgi:hypothetical protein